jgi:heme exporter protein D
MAEWFGMGGYGAYVWPAYAVFLLVLALEALLGRAQHRRALAALRARIRRRAARGSGA